MPRTDPRITTIMQINGVRSHIPELTEESAWRAFLEENIGIRSLMPTTEADAQRILTKMQAIRNEKFVAKVEKLTIPDRENPSHKVDNMPNGQEVNKMEEKTENFWKKEKENMERGYELDSWFTPEIGKKYNIKILEQVTEENYFESEYKGEEIRKLRVPIEVEGKKYQWSISVGKTVYSLYGQIISLFSSWDGKTEGKTLHLEVKGDDELKPIEKQKRKFVIAEAVDLIKQSETKKA